MIRHLDTTADYQTLAAEEPTFRVWEALQAENNPRDWRFREQAIRDRVAEAARRLARRYAEEATR